MTLSRINYYVIIVIVFSIVGCVGNNNTDKEQIPLKFQIKDAGDVPTGKIGNSSTIYFLTNESVLLLTQSCNVSIDWNKLTIYFTIENGDGRYTCEILQINNGSFNKFSNHITKYNDDIYLGNPNMDIKQNDYIRIIIFEKNNKVYQSETSIRVQ